MEVQRRSMLQGALKAKGYTVVIDVFRAFTCTSILFSKGVASVKLVGDPNIALSERTDRNTLVVGEVNGKKYPGFDYGNSPSIFLQTPDKVFKGKKIIQRTSAGTRGAIAAMTKSKKVFVAGYVNAKATASALSRLCNDNNQNDLITIVGMGMHGEEKSLEDEYCGDYIEHILTGKKYNHLAAIWEILNEPFTKKNLDSYRAHFPREDVILALQKDVFDFALMITENSSKDNICLSCIYQ